MRLIDADKLRGHKPFTIRGGPIGDYYEGYSDCAMEADEAVQNAPTVDAVPVVRCKDCTYYHPDSCALPDGSGANWGVCEKLLDSDTEDEIQTSDEGFCWFAMKAGEACD